MVTNRPFSKTKLPHALALAILATIMLPLGVQSEESPEAVALSKPANSTPWGFNLTTYLWLPGADGSFTAGTNSGSVDASFIDIVNKSRRIPLGFMGRFEAHYDRFAFYVDGNYFNLQLKPVLGQNSSGINSEIGVMDYGLMYRVFGATASQTLDYEGIKRPNRLDVYVGARTLWLDNSFSVAGPFGLIQTSPSSSKSFTSPIIGGRIIVDLTPSWFVLADGNFGGFGAQNVDFTGSLMGLVGYRMSLFGHLASVEAGYKALRYKVDPEGSLATTVTLNGPFIGLSGQW